MSWIWGFACLSLRFAFASALSASKDAFQTREAPQFTAKDPVTFMKVDDGMKKHHKDLKAVNLDATVQRLKKKNLKDIRLLKKAGIDMQAVQKDIDAIEAASKPTPLSDTASNPFSDRVTMAHGMQEDHEKREELKERKTKSEERTLLQSQMGDEALGPATAAEPEPESQVEPVRLKTYRKNLHGPGELNKFQQQVRELNFELARAKEEKEKNQADLASQLWDEKTHTLRIPANLKTRHIPPTMLKASSH